MRALKGKPDEESSGKARIKESVIIERFSAERASELRLLLLRDEIGRVVERMGESYEDLRCVGELLSDPGLAVGVIAADALKEAAGKGIDIGICVEALESALGDKYARRNAAGALARQYILSGQEEKAAGLMVSPEADIAEGAMEAVREIAARE